MARSTVSKINFSSTYKFDCYREGELVWTETRENLVVNEGLELALDVIFGEKDKPVFYVGLIANNAAIIPEDTMSTHNYVEFEGTVNIRRSRAYFVKGELKDDTWSYVAPATQAMIGANGQIYGAFLTTGDMKGERAGLLYGASLMTTPKTVVPGDALLITITVKATG